MCCVWRRYEIRQLSRRYIYIMVQLRFQARVGRQRQGFSERATDVASGSSVDPDPATTSRSAAASMAVDFHACAPPPGFGASRQWCSSRRARRCAPPRARMQRGSIDSPRLVAPHAARVRARECRRVRCGLTPVVSPLSCSRCSACCSQVGCQVLGQLHLILPWSSKRLIAVRAAVVLPGGCAPWTRACS